MTKGQSQRSQRRRSPRTLLVQSLLSEKADINQNFITDNFTRRPAPEKSLGAADGGYLKLVIGNRTQARFRYFR